MKTLPHTLLMNGWRYASSRQPKFPSRAIRLVITTVLFTLLTPATIELVRAEGQASPFASQSAHDPGVRTDAVDAGQPLANLAQTPGAADFFANGQARFTEIDGVHGGANNGLGPRFNTNQCSSCHSQPNV